VRDALRVPAAALHGGLDREARAAALADFTSGRLAILLTTDAAGEGLNLHHACRIVVTLELPWNPMRLEQRIGRVDRIGQRRTVHAVHLIARDTSETRILERLRARVAQAQADVGAADPLGPDDGDDNDDRAVARFLIGSVAAHPSPTDDGPHEREALVPSDLRLEAVAESARLVQARRLRTVHRISEMNLDPLLGRLETDGAWLSFTRPSGSFPRARILLIVRAAYEDPAGRLIESTLVPLAIACGGPRPPLDGRRLVEEVVKSVMEKVGQDEGHPFRRAITSWHDTALAFTCAFFDTRLARERAIAAAARVVAPRTFQPGLFDRRAAHRHLAARTFDADGNMDASVRLIALEDASRVVARPPQLLLVLAC